MKINSIAKLCILALLKEGKLHGYEILKDLERKTGVKLSASHIYPFLKELKRNNMVSLEKTSKGHEKNIYCLTEKGKSFYNSLMKRFSLMLESGIKENITKCYHCKCDIYKNHYYNFIRGQKRAFCCIHCAKAYKQHPR